MDYVEKWCVIQRIGIVNILWTGTQQQVKLLQKLLGKRTRFVGF